MKQKTMFKLKALVWVLVLSFGIMSANAYADEVQFFTDVDESDYFYDAVIWASDAGITNGVGNNLYDPEGQVTRAQIVTFLWRMAGEPEPENNETFADVEAGSWYETAVKWAVEQNITNGTGDNQFSPDLTCDRAMCMTLLYRMMGSTLDEAAAAEPVELTDDSTWEDFGNYMLQQMIELYRNPIIFPDVIQDSYYELAVIWGGMNGIITEDNTGEMVEGVLFRSYDPCIRAEMISFLYQTKLMQDAMDAPDMYESGPVTIVIPKAYEDLLYKTVYSLEDDEDGMIISVSEKASCDAAEAMGYEDPEEAGWLFSIGRVSEEELCEMLCWDMSGAEVFAIDDYGKYYVFYHPTDVRYVRETNEQMVADQDQWTELNEWAWEDVRDSIIENSYGLTPITFTNTSLDMNLARAAYQEDTKYTVSAAEYGTLEPGYTYAAPYVNFLLNGNFVWADDISAPDGEYVSLNFPNEDVRYDFFFADGNLVREVSGEDVFFYERLYPDFDFNNTEVMQSWYYAIAENAGKRERNELLDDFAGLWLEKGEDDGVFMIISETVASDKMLVEITDFDNGGVAHDWIIMASLTEDGKLLYEDGLYTASMYDEYGEEIIIDQSFDESGSLTVNDAGEITWLNSSDDGDTKVVFERFEEEW